MNPYLLDGTKLVWHMSRVDDYFKYKRRIVPLHVDIGITKACNAKCVFCYGIYQKMTKEIMPRNVIINLLADAPKLGVKSLTITGDGEPTLNPAVYDAVKIGKLHGLDIGFATNGIALDSTKIKVLLDSCAWLRFNLSAINSRSYKSIHGVDQWERVRDNILLAVKIKKEHKYNCTIGLQMVLIPQCIEQILPEAQFARNFELDYFVIKQFSDPGCKEMSQFSLKWYDNDEVQTRLEIAERMSTSKTKIIPKYGMIKSKGKRPYDRCVDLPLLFQISGNSKCYPCGYLFNNPRFCYGDLRKQSLGEILKSKRYWDIIEYMRTEFDVHSDCSGCCRHDFTNEFIWEYLHPPEHINFI